MVSKELHDVTELDLNEVDARARNQLDELESKRASLAWLESRIADLQFEVESLRARLQESQCMRRILEERLASVGNSFGRSMAEPQADEGTNKRLAEKLPRI